MKVSFNRPLDPIYLVLLFTLIAVIVGILMKDNPDVLTYFLTLIGIGMSAAMVQCYILQIEIQKDNIKLQMFDKRYQVLQTVLDSITLVQRDNWDRLILLSSEQSRQCDINTQIVDIEERLRQSVDLSIALFDPTFNNKLSLVSKAYSKVAKAYKDMLVQNVIYLQESDNKLQSFVKLMGKYYTNVDNSAACEFDQELEKELPKVFGKISEFNQECSRYMKVIDETDILNDFNKYVIIRDLGL